MKKRANLIFLLFLVALSVSFSSAQTAKPAASPAAGYRFEFLRELDIIEKRYLKLAEEVPADKYKWRPVEGTRSVSEVFMHVAAKNFNTPKNFGTPLPAGFVFKGYDTTETEKAKVAQKLKDSFAHIRKAVLALSDSDADKEKDLTIVKFTYRALLLIHTRELAEYLGMATAYARINGVSPNWTEAPGTN